MLFQKVIFALDIPPMDWPGASVEERLQGEFLLAGLNVPRI